MSHGSFENIEVQLFRSLVLLSGQRNHGLPAALVSANYVQVEGYQTYSSPDSRNGWNCVLVSPNNCANPWIARTLSCFLRNFSGCDYRKDSMFASFKDKGVYRSLRNLDCLKRVVQSIPGIMFLHCQESMGKYRTSTNCALASMEKHASTRNSGLHPDKTCVNGIVSQCS